MCSKFVDLTECFNRVKKDLVKMLEGLPTHFFDLVLELRT